jgi:hypothetical protein
MFIPGRAPEVFNIFSSVILILFYKKCFIGGKYFITLSLSYVLPICGGYCKSIIDIFFKVFMMFYL